MLNFHNKRRAGRRTMLGMSIVEILAAMLVGLIGMTIIMQVYSLSEERKRTTTGTGDAQISGNIAMFTLERELRVAGFGMVTNAGNMLGCTVIAYDSTRGNVATEFPVMAPITITAGTGSVPDSFVVIYGNSWSAAEPVVFTAAAPRTDPFPLKNAGGFQLGDIVFAHQGTSCQMAEVTGFSAGALNSVEHATGGAYSYVDINGNTVNATAKYNDAAVAGTNPVDSKLFSMGRNPVVREYYVDTDNAKLMSRGLFPYDAAQDADTDGWSDAEVADGIVNLKVQYGKGPEGTPLTWDNIQPANEAEWLNVRAVRIALLARSGQLEKTDVTDTAPEWYGTPFVMQDLDDGTSWKRYRYRVYQTVVPLRNTIWSNDAT
jgi:type IV pilus assembly protein PilW